MMKLFRTLSLRLPLQKMEEEYASLRQENITRDFNAALSLVITINLIMAAYLAIAGDPMGSYFSVGEILLAASLFCIRRLCKNRIQYLMLLLLCTYSVSRLSLIASRHSKIDKDSMFFNGFGIATINLVIISRIHKLPHKILGVIISFVLRFAIIYGTTEGKASPAIVLVRHLIMDIFLVYMFYSIEKTNRKVFLQFYQNREELIKFKELLKDSLPQSVTVIDCSTHQPLFSNNSFISTFEHGNFLPKPIRPCSNTERQLMSQCNDNAKPCLNYLSVDIMSIREAGAMEATSSTPYIDGNSLTLEEVIWKLTGENILDGKALSLAASYTYQDQTRSLEVTLKKIKWDNADAVAVILNDITYQKNIIALKAANTNKDKIIATVSHELRTPLHVMLGLLEITETKVENPEVSRELLLCKNNAHLLWSLVSSILDFHQINTGNLSLNIAVVDIRQALDEVLELFRFQCVQKNIYLQLEVHDSVPDHITTDKNRLSQILVNLVSNAIKFTFSGGIKVYAAQDADEPEYLQISVSDTGIGIKDEEKRNLFKMDSRLERKESVNKNGVGLGLTISNALAMVLCGNIDKGIEVKSVYGSGSTFYFKVLKDMSEFGSIDEGFEHKKESDEFNFTNRLTIPSEQKKAVKDKNKDFGEDEVRSLDSSSCFREFESRVDVDTKIAGYSERNKRNSLDLQHLPKGADSGKGKGILPLEIKKRLERQQEANMYNNLTSRSPHSHHVECSQGNNCELRKENDKALYGSVGSVLVVDDNPFNLLIAENFLKSLTVSVKTALGGKEAIEVARSLTEEGQVLKAILMDCQMPVMDGYETTKVLKEMMERNEIQKVPILAWTANNSREDIERCLACGMVGHLSKPTSQEALRETLRNLESG